MKNIREALKYAADILKSNEITEFRREAVSLLSLALKKDKTFLIAHDDYELSAAEQNHFQKFLERRLSREPLQYIRGEQEFYGLDFIVTPDVLIPRPETELIVENALEILRGKPDVEFCEVGVGSGCISISILHELEDTRATGLDISDAALKIARENAEKHQVFKRFKLENSDVFEVLRDEKFALIVSNPPYIPAEDMNDLQPEVREFEPHSALTDGGDGLSIIRKIVTAAPRFLQKEGFLLMEIGFDQSEKVSEMFAETIWRSLELLPDLQGIPRTVKAQKG